MRRFYNTFQSHVISHIVLAMSVDPLRINLKNPEETSLVKVETRWMKHNSGL